MKQMKEDAAAYKKWKQQKDKEVLQLQQKVLSNSKFRKTENNYHNRLTNAVMYPNYVRANLSEEVTQGKPKNWLLKTGDPLILVHLHCILVQGTGKKWLLKAGDPLIEVAT